MIEVFKTTHKMKHFLLIFLPMQGLILEAVTTNSLIIYLIVTYTSVFSLHVLFTFGTVCVIQLLMLVLLMHLEHG